MREGLRSASRAVETRRELDVLDVHILADLGLTPVQAEREARRAPWDLAPARLNPGTIGACPDWTARTTILARRTTSSVPGWQTGGGLSGAWNPGLGSGPLPRDPTGPRLGGLGRWVVEAYRRRRSRQAITELDAFLLKDIGVSYAEAEHEANKPFWR